MLPIWWTSSNFNNFHFHKILPQIDRLKRHNFRPWLEMRKHWCSRIIQKLMSKFKADFWSKTLLPFWTGTFPKVNKSQDRNWSLEEQTRNSSLFMEFGFTSLKSCFSAKPRHSLKIKASSIFWINPFRKTLPSSMLQISNIKIISKDAKWIFGISNQGKFYISVIGEINRSRMLFRSPKMVQWGQSYAQICTTQFFCNRYLFSSASHSHFISIQYRIWSLQRKILLFNFAAWWTVAPLFEISNFQSEEIFSGSMYYS